MDPNHIETIRSPKDSGDGGGDDEGDDDTIYLSALKRLVVPFPFPLPPELEDEVLLDRIVPGRAEVVLLGESTHGTHEFYQLRCQLTKRLVRDRGFRAILLEAEWPDMYRVNQHLTRPDSPYPDSVSVLARYVKGHGRHMWQNRETAELLDWIKSFNESQGYRPESNVHVLGMDCQQIYRSLDDIYSTLADLDFALCSDLRARLAFFEGHSRDEYQYARQTVRGIGSEQIPEILQTILSEFQWSHFDRLRAKVPSDRVVDVLNVEQNLEVLVNAEEYFRKRVLEPPGSNVSWNARDQHMALTVSRIRERLRHIAGTAASSASTDGKEGGAGAAAVAAAKSPSSSSLSSSATVAVTKVVVWAHNSHVGNSTATSRGGADFARNESWNLGQMVRHITAADRCFTLGLDTYQGTVTALKDRGDGDGDSTSTYDLLPAVGGSSEHLCHRLCEDMSCKAFLLPLQGTDGDVAVNGEIGDGSATPVTRKRKLQEALSRRIPQRYVGVNYRRNTEMRSHYTDASLIGQYDALVFIDATTALRVFNEAELRNAALAVASGRDASSSGRATTTPSNENRGGARRLMRELARLRRNPVPGIRVCSEETDLYRCHFVLTFDSGPYAGGEYHGLLDLPREYPLAPPSISFYTPSGRFETGRKVCVSFSDYHPELWNPSWGIESVLVGLQSFMQEECPEALGSVLASADTRRRLAEESRKFNSRDDMYQQLFSEDVSGSGRGQTRNHGKGGESEEEKKGEDQEDLPCCRYCRSTGGELVSPCNCRGDLEWVHRECLAKWQYQAILSQSTHPKHQTGIEKICNVCRAEFRILEHSREGLILSFTGAEMAGMVERGCLLVATERSSRRNEQLMEAYEDLREKLCHWTRSVFLITECISSPDGKKQSILGLSLTNEQPNFNSRAMERLGLNFLQNTRTFVGGPMYQDFPFVLFAVRTSKLGSNTSRHCSRVLMEADGGDLSIWFASSINGVGGGNIHRALEWAGEALVDMRVFWGCAGWDRVQLLGEIARGGWGLATGRIDEAWHQPSDQCWQSTLKRAIFAGANDFSKFNDND